MTSSPGHAQGLDVSKPATNDTQLLVDIGLQKGSQLGSMDIPHSGMVDLSTEFVEEAHSLSAKILNELNKLKQLTATKKAYFGESFAWMAKFYCPSVRMACSPPWVNLTEGKLQHW